MTDPRADSAPTAAGVAAPRIHYGPYRIVSFLGKGGMGAVYLAEQENLSRKVALKVLPDTVDPIAIERFRREAHAVAGLNHPRIAQVLDFGADQGTLYYAMEFVEGKSLRAAMDTERIDFRRAAEIVRGVAEGVAHAHERGVVHRDLKPANVILDRDGRPKVVDFGLARVSSDRSLTNTGELLGTPKYMSPEQADGQPHVGPPSDVYSLGVTLFELVALRPPFDEEDNARLLVRIVMDESPRPSELRAGIPKDLETVIMKCLEKEPSGRYPTARELAEDLRRWLDGEPVLAQPIGPLKRLWRRARRWRATIAAAVLVAGASGVLLAVQARRSALAEERFRTRQEAAGILTDVERRANIARRNHFEFGQPLDRYRQAMRECAGETLRAAAADPQWSVPISAAATYLRASGETRRARDAYRRALQLDPDDPAALLGMAEIRIEEATLHLVGLGVSGNAGTYCGSRLLRDAQGDLERLRTRGVADPDVLARAEALDLVAKVALMKANEAGGAATEAARRLEVIAGESNSPGMIWIYAGMTHARRVPEGTNASESANSEQRIRADMTRCVNRAAELMPRSAYARLFQGFMEEKQLRHEVAMEIYDEVTRMDPLMALGWMSRGSSRYAWHKWRAEHPEPGMDQEAEQAEFRKRIPEFLADVEKAIALDPSPMYLVTRGEIHYIHALQVYFTEQRCDAAMWDAALSDYAEFMRTFPESSQTWDHIGGAHYWAATASERAGAGDLKDRAAWIEAHYRESIACFDRVKDHEGAQAKFMAYRMRSKLAILNLRKKTGALDEAAWKARLEELMPEADAMIVQEYKDADGVLSSAAVPIVRARLLVLLGRKDEAVAWLEGLLRKGQNAEVMQNLPGFIEQLKSQ